ncbi:hypothetical protein H4696_009777 [Amycolatopsis lexingtonensis]|uniref:Uncharacterized protein n=1 Tax=Amycolatopsis lexingtonensis TaxID=218822 RepID=A0ABR9IHL4_9PSEU|nr:hypothetical protein [Amycolatopsis lexingtonensis]MBE1502677.1 hypothetical protein [Amycolatopsis lexingtonensis]
MSDVRFTVTSDSYRESGNRGDAVQAWQTARESAIKKCFDHHPTEPVTITVGKREITAMNRANLIYEVDRQIRDAKR